MKDDSEMGCKVLRSGAALGGLLVMSGCFLASEPFAAPAPAQRPSLEVRIRADSTDADAVVGLSILELNDGRLEPASALLERAYARMPSDPAIPLLLGRTAERVGRYTEARAVYEAYVPDRAGPLVDYARTRLDALRPGALRGDARVLLAVTSTDPVLDPNRVVVLPFAHVSSGGVEEASAVAVADLMTGELTGRWRPVDTQLVRLLVDEAGWEAEELADLSIGLRAGRLLGAGRIVQGRASDVLTDSLAWDVTVLSLEEDGRVGIAHMSLLGAVRNVAGMERRLAMMVRELLDGSVQRDRLGRIHTEVEAAIPAFGTGLLAWDRGETESARIAFEEAVALDVAFREPAGLAVRMSAVLEDEASELVERLTELARIAELQRSVTALRGGAGSVHQAALARVGARDRPILTDALGFDRVGGSIILELRLVPPGVVVP